ncbi:MAG: Universal stress protein [Methanomethylovorans sp. PtaU1.Bin073]|nr:MAG: Universal stress protein [Methanomethylovorans sp. PtaU1.Bin073]
MALNNTFQKILIATDGSKCSENAVLKGMEIAKSMDSKVYALYVLDTCAYVPSMLKGSPHLGSKWDVIKDMIRQEGDDAIRYATKVAADKDIDCEGVIAEGDAAHEIMEFAERNDVDMIVMGTLGRGGLQRFLLGSVADKVMRHSKISVLVVRKEKQN